MGTFNVLGAWAGLIGGFTGLLGFGLQVWFHYATGPKVKVKVSWAIDLNLDSSAINVSAVNTGRMQALVESASVAFSTESHSPFAFYPAGSIVGPTLPLVLEPQSAANWLVSKEMTLNAIKNQHAKRTFRIQIRLATGKVICSKWVEINH
jgi:DNA-binding sugar fermentation-stimulating protein